MDISLLWNNGQYVIVEDARGATITNQTNGVCCSHPETKGFLIPLPRTFEGLKWRKDPIFDSSANYLNYPLDGAMEKYTQCLIDNGFRDAKIIKGHEAWIHFTYESKTGIKTAILTWENSD